MIKIIYMKPYMMFKPELTANNNLYFVYAATQTDTDGQCNLTIDSNPRASDHFQNNNNNNVLWMTQSNKIWSNI